MRAGSAVGLIPSLLSLVLIFFVWFSFNSEMQENTRDVKKLVESLMKEQQFSIKGLDDNIVASINNLGTKSEEQVAQVIAEIKKIKAAPAPAQQASTSKSSSSSSKSIIEDVDWDFPENAPIPKISIASNMDGWHMPVNPKMVNCPDLRCEVVEASDGRTDFQNSDALVVLGSEMNDQFISNIYQRHGKKKGGRYFVLTGEPDSKFPGQRHQLIDAYVSTDLANDVPVIASHWVPVNFDPGYVQLNKRSDAVASIWVSNCGAKNGRNEWFQTLMGMMSVHSYGQCYHNKNWDGGDKGKESLERIFMLGSYKFCLPFENSNEVGYVTEKIFMALASGCVPIYMGWDAIDNYLPDPNSIIKTSQFSSATELGNYMKKLLDEPAEYNKYLKWKTEARPIAKMKRLHKLGELNWGCRMCHHLSRRGGHHVRQRSLSFKMGIAECNIPKYDDMPANTGTLELWVKTSKRSDQALLSCGNIKGNGWIFSILGGNGLGFCGAEVWYKSDQANIADGTWHHIAAAFSSTGERYMYFDGKLLSAANNISPVPFVGRVTGITIGVQGHENGNRDVNTFHGLMDEIRIWNVVRSAEQIQRDYNARLHGKEDGLFAYFRPSFDGMNNLNFLWDFAGKTHARTHDAMCENTVFDSDTPKIGKPRALVTEE